MTFTEAVQSVFNNFSNFSGRARRKEYWYFVLFTLLGGAVVEGIGRVIGAERVLSGLFSLVILIPGLAVAFRRLHDTGRAGWWILLGFVPMLGIIPLIFCCLDSQPGDNAYGPNPKGIDYTF